MDDFRGELREHRDEDCGEPRAVRAFVAREAASVADLVEVRRQRIFRVRRNSGAGAEKMGVGSRVIKGDCGASVGASLDSSRAAHVKIKVY